MQEIGRNRKRESVRLVCNIKRARKMAKKQITHILYKTEGNIIERVIEKGNIKTCKLFVTTFFSLVTYKSSDFFFCLFCYLSFQWNRTESKNQIDGTTNKAYLLEKWHRTSKTIWHIAEESEEKSEREL